MNAKAGKNLRHLAVMSKNIADETGLRGAAAQMPDQAATHAQIAHQRFAGNQKLVRHDIPGAHDQPARFGQAFYFSPLFRPGLEIILNQNRLSVCLKGALQPAILPTLQQMIHQLHQTIAKILKTLVPLTVPVGAQYIMNLT